MQATSSPPFMSATPGPCARSPSTANGRAAAVPPEDRVVMADQRDAGAAAAVQPGVDVQARRPRRELRLPAEQRQPRREGVRERVERGGVLARRVGVDPRREVREQLVQARVRGVAHGQRARRGGPGHQR